MSWWFLAVATVWVAIAQGPTFANGALLRQVPHRLLLQVGVSKDLIGVVPLAETNS
jgi:hypothetical protein